MGQSTPSSEPLPIHYKMAAERIAPPPSVPEREQGSSVSFSFTNIPQLTADLQRQTPDLQRYQGERKKREEVVYAISA
jgi:hypothetical protein